MATLDLSLDVVALTAALVDIPSESFHEGAIAEAVEQAVRGLPHLAVERFGNTVVARTELGRAERVVIAGHIDTVPANDNLPHRLEFGVLHGLGSVDMKGGVAVALRIAATVPEPNRDITFIWYDAEEVESVHNGLGKLAAARPDLLVADLAILGEPSNAGIEAGCQGTLRLDVTTRGTRAHSARSWMGDNAIHAAGDILSRIKTFDLRRPDVDGMQYREGLNAVGIRGGVAGNVVPDECVVTINYRFAPDRTGEDAVAVMREVFDGFDIDIVDVAEGARPGLDRPAAKAFVAAVGAEPTPKYGWTDVARFSALGIPALNFGPGDPMLAHRADERVPTTQLTFCETALRDWLTA